MGTELTQAGRLSLVKRARKICQGIIRNVEIAYRGQVVTDLSFFATHMKESDQLASVLDLLGIPFPPASCQFDRVPTRYGLPVIENGWFTAGLATPLIPAWLEAMRAFDDGLEKPTVRVTDRPGSGGRPKSKATKQLEKDLVAWLKGELSRLLKEGLTQPLAAKHVIDRGARCVLQAINESLGRNYPVDDTTRKKLQRLEPWRGLKEASDGGLNCAAGEQNPEPARDHQWALEQGLRVKARQ